MGAGCRVWGRPVRHREREPRERIVDGGNVAGDVRALVDHAEEGGVVHRRRSRRDDRDVHHVARRQLALLWWAVAKELFAERLAELGLCGCFGV